jgi:hypothetical protein
MYDCSAEISQFHTERVELTIAERKLMQARRDANRERLTNGLTKKFGMSPAAFDSQGSYAMKTMVQSAPEHVDIDDGVYFAREKVVSADGKELSALQVRQRIAEAAQDAAFSKHPEVRETCVRVHYADGHHVDVPSYRVSAGSGLVEVAGANWKASDARANTQWFEDENARLSPKDDAELFRKVVRLIKGFARSRDKWLNSIAGGFCIAKLTSECYYRDSTRLDVVFRATCANIYRRLLASTVVRHPVVAEDISKSNPDPKTAYLRDRLEENLPHLEILDQWNCSQADARNAWDRFFGTDWFSKNSGGSDDGSKGGRGPTIIPSGNPPPVTKRGGHGYA